MRRLAAWRDGSAPDGQQPPAASTRSEGIMRDLLSSVGSPVLNGWTPASAQDDDPSSEEQERRAKRMRGDDDDESSSC